MFLCFPLRKCLGVCLTNSKSLYSLFHIVYLMDDEIVLNKDLLKAIGADTRITILKSLSERRKTQSELADGLKLSSPTIIEHLENLISANLVEKIDEGRKWKYYQLTKLGKKLITSSQNKTSINAFVVLGAALMLVVGWIYLFNPFSVQANTIMDYGKDGSPNELMEITNKNEYRPEAMIQKDVPPSQEMTDNTGASDSLEQKSYSGISDNITTNITNNTNRTNQTID